MKLQRRRQMRGKILRVVPARVYMKFVGNVARVQHLVERGCSRLEPVIILVAAIEINVQSREIGCFRNRNWALLRPVRCVGWVAKRGLHCPRARRSRTFGAEKRGKFIDQRSTVGADGRKKLWMTKGHMQRAVPTHGNSRNAA